MMNSDFKLDKQFGRIIRYLGSPTSSIPVSDSVLEKYENKLPSRLLEYWKEFGFCGFKDGYFWIVNPDDYNEILAQWLEGTSIENDDNYYVIARNAFGELFVWAEKSGLKYTIETSFAWIIESEGAEKEIASGNENDALQFFFGSTGMFSDELERNDDNGKPLFERCKKKFGALDYNEMYTFEPAVFLGGASSINNMAKVDIFVQLSMLASFGQKELLDEAGLIAKAF
ncbi:GAD-like domain-containing protein [Ningiella sp. W23]|uniref:GAD-like domain-containing protein n=1 Tax=Ningiella sp. W23 TaxID=3023715 RepID=UPI003757F33D